MTYDVAVVGGGIVGLATTRELGLRFPGLRLANVEKEPGHNRHQTGRNSGVIHAGLVYAPGSLKAQLCCEGRDLAYAYCDEHGIPYKRIGKLIVATEERELAQLQRLYERGQANGVPGLALLDAAQIRERESHVRGLRAIWSPVTGIVDWSRVAGSYANDARNAGADLFLGREVRRIERRDGVTHLHTPLGTVSARAVITCGGLYSDRLARMTGGTARPKIVPFRGDYLILRPERTHLVGTNVYPVPDPAFPFLGTHFTPRMDGSVWLGPNAVLAFAREGYALTTLNPAELWESLTYPGFLRLARAHWRAGAGEFYRDVVRRAYVRELQRFVPELQPADCLPGPSGVRAQAVAADGSMVDDFVIDAAEGAVHVRNAPSPAATSSLALAKRIVDEAARHFDLRGKPTSNKQGDGSVSSPTSVNMELFVEAAWLLAHLNDRNVRVVDARSQPHGAPGVVTKTGGEQFAEGHIPGAVQLDYADQLAHPETPHACRVAPAELFAQVLGEHGIGDDSTIVAYDDGTVPFAARFVWMCHYYGHDDVHILAGGLPAWVAAGGALTAAVDAPAPATFTPRERPQLRATRDEVLAVAEGRSDAQLLETQRDATYALRDRDIAGARRLSGSTLLEDANGGRFAPRAVIDELVEAAGLERTKRTLVSCGSGVAASGSYLALLENGFTDVAVYDGSWLEWDHHKLPTVPKPPGQK